MTSCQAEFRTGQPRRALVLTGGGARGAYQVGVIKAIAELLPDDAPLPFRIICGTSAGAIIGTILAGHAGRFREGAATLERFWSHFKVDQVWRNDLVAVMGAGLRWLGALFTGGALTRPPSSLFDNQPLRVTLESHINFARVQQALQSNRLDALAVMASPYGGSRAHAYYMSREGATTTFPGWSGGTPTDLSFDHLMASSAVPFLFPAIWLDDGYYGDGAMRQSEPLAPAINLGADRVLVIGVRAHPPQASLGISGGVAQPSFGQIFGFMLDTLFMTSLPEEIARIDRENRLIENAGEALSGLRQIRTLLIEPTTDPSELVSHHAATMPFAVRLLMRFLGAANRGGRHLLSYLLFDGGYARQLIALGYADAMANRQAIQSFLSNDE